MISDEPMWIGRDGQRFGPYMISSIREWLANGKLSFDTLAWQKGMAEWAPLSVMFAAEQPETPPFREPPPPPESPYGSAFASSPESRAASSYAARAALPKPPALHWFVVALLSVVTLGIFQWVWMFRQSSWIKKVDPASKATGMMIAGLCVAFLGGFVQGFAKTSGVPAVALIGSLLSLASPVLMIVSYFAMRRSLERVAAERNLPMSIGGVTLFFFQVFYLQGQLSWLARWKETGATEPAPPKATMWLMMIPFVAIILLAIALPAYQGYTKRMHANAAPMYSTPPPPVR